MNNENSHQENEKAQLLAQVYSVLIRAANSTKSEPPQIAIPVPLIEASSSVHAYMRGV